MCDKVTTSFVLDDYMQSDDLATIVRVAAGMTSLILANLFGTVTCAMSPLIQVGLTRIDVCCRKRLTLVLMILSQRLLQR